MCIWNPFVESDDVYPLHRFVVCTGLFFSTAEVLFGYLQRRCTYNDMLARSSSGSSAAELTQPKDTDIPEAV
jgi:hypothetical protein